MAVQAPPQPHVKFAMPEARMAEVVLFHTNLGEAGGNLALVMAVGSRTIDILHLGSNRFFGGIRHRTDPELRTHADLLTDTGGCWEQSPESKRHRDMEMAMLRISEEQAEILARLKRLETAGGKRPAASEL